MSGGQLIAIANHCPIDVGAQVFAADSSSGFALDIDCELFSTELSVDHIPEMTKGRSATACESISLIRVHRKVKRFKFHASDYIHRLVSINHFMVNIFSPVWC